MKVGDISLFLLADNVEEEMSILGFNFVRFDFLTKEQLFFIGCTDHLKSHSLSLMYNNIFPSVYKPTFP